MVIRRTPRLRNLGVRQQFLVFFFFSDSHLNYTLPASHIMRLTLRIKPHFTLPSSGVHNLSITQCRDLIVHKCRQTLHTQCLNKLCHYTSPFLNAAKFARVHLFWNTRYYQLCSHVKTSIFNA